MSREKIIVGKKKLPNQFISLNSFRILVILLSLISKKYKNIYVIDTKEINTNFLDDIDCLVNCSTCGMKKDDILPFKINSYNKDIVFYDIIYNKQTPFKKFALKNKIKYFSGEGMLIYQAAVSFYRWTNIFPETKNIFNLIKKNLEQLCS